ncbi:hypothetical protein [Streptomyces sp. cg35]|uniref:hypothetical protein n=1 Tax=Streptomyces sp. cg35 TaxID=3421650 RepID=UPI003D1778D5
MANWPNKTIPELTDAELVAAIEEHQFSSDRVTRQIVQGCIREWERRNGLSDDS